MQYTLFGWFSFDENVVFSSSSNWFSFEVYFVHYKMAVPVFFLGLFAWNNIFFKKSIYPEVIFTINVKYCLDCSTRMDPVFTSNILPYVFLLGDESTGALSYQ